MTKIIAVGVIALLCISSLVLNQNKPKLKITKNTINLEFSPEKISAGINKDFSVKMVVKPSADTVLRGYETKINFDKTKIAFKSIKYLAGSVSKGLGDTNEQTSEINGVGNIKIIGEFQSVDGYPLTSKNNTEIIVLTFTILKKTPASINFGDSSFYSLNPDSSLYNGWVFTKNTLRVN